MCCFWNGSIMTIHPLLINAVNSIDTITRVNRLKRSTPSYA